MDFKLKAEFIELDNVLKAARLVASGGDAKQRILAGAVKVNGEPELRVRRKLRAGDRIEFEGEVICLIEGIQGDNV